MGRMKEFRDEQEGETLEVLDFGWGDTRGLRKKILSIYRNLNIMQTMPLESYGYPPLEGDLELVEMLRKLTNDLTGHTYKKICITSGCTNAVNASIYALANSKTKNVITRKIFYPQYPKMIGLTSYTHKTWDTLNTKDCIAIVDSPSNPLGEITVDQELLTENIIWDAAYHSPTYGVSLGVNSVPNHKVFCGSLSKLTGINGIRLGWAATDDDALHDKIEEYVRYSVCGVSYPSQYVAKEILKDEANLSLYFIQSRKLIDMNREEVLKLKHIFGSDHIPNFGMFAFFRTDDKMEELFERAKVKFTSGSECGADYQSVRINLGNTNEMTQEMVNRILKADRSR
jgi:aspartate/methionine/tyrosine aminotransferase